MKTEQWMMDSKVGPLYLVASEKGLQGVFWKRQPVPMAKSLKGQEPEIRILAQAAEELEEYFEGTRTRFDLPLDIRGTAFQERVWDRLRRIPYGKTSSYREIASQLKNEGAVRAVGTANGKNPLCIVIPCHRVIAADGSLGGYSGGLNVKNELLRLERKK